MIDIGKAGTFTLGTRSVKRLATAPCSSPARASSGPRRIARVRSPCCARRWTAASTTSTPATSTARTSPTRSSARRCIRIRTTLVIVTKIGTRRGADGAWLPAMSGPELTQAVHDNLRNLGLDVIEAVNLRSMFSMHGPAEGSLEEPLTALAELQRQAWCATSA